MSLITLDKVSVWPPQARSRWKELLGFIVSHWWLHCRP